MKDISKVRVGIAGLGRLGQRHAENLAFRIRDADLVWACSPIEAELTMAHNAWGVPQLTTDFRTMLQAPDLDAVVLVTPTVLHAEQAIAVLEAGKHLFVEKPLALQVEDCERVETVALRRPHLVAMVGFVRRFDKSYRRAYEQIQRADIGRPFMVRSQTCDMNDPTGFFVQYAAQSGGIFMDCSVHDIDLARWMLGHPKAQRVFASGTVALHSGLTQFGDVDNGVAVVEFEGGSRAIFYASRTFAHGHETQTEVIGTRGKLLIGHGAARDRVVTSDARGVRFDATPDFFERFGDAFQQEMSAFISAIRGESSLDLHFSDATEATRIAEAMTRALHSGQVEEVGFSRM